MGGKSDQLAKLASRQRQAPSNSVSEIERRAAAAAAGVAARHGDASATSQTLPNSSAVAFRPAAPEVPRFASGIVDLPLDKIDDNPYNVRALYPAEDLSDLAMSIQANGQEQPIKAFPKPDGSGRYISVFGHRRRRACAIAGKLTVRAELCAPMNDRELYSASDAENGFRTQQTPIDDALVWQKLLKDKVFNTQSELAAASRKSEGTVAKTLALLEMPATLLDYVKEHPQRFGLRVAYELYTLAKKGFQTEALDLAKRVVVEELAAKEVESTAKHIASPKERKEKESSRQYKLTPNDIYLSGVIKDFDSGRVIVEVSVSSPEDRARLVTTLKRTLGVPN
ncbi:MAG: ParB/RepB/Spo0J family partition protein [Rhodocyclaceae bacterium]|nr:ParB/RepB/Spo0J family partition protein [Rhodocyclaceae bacterium]